METEDWTPVLDAQRRSDDRVIIDALVAALEEARDHIRNCHGTDERPDSDSADIVRTADAALALAREGG